MPPMDAVVLDEWGGDLTVQSVDVPEPDAGEVRVDVRACGVTRTIENAVQGGLSDDPALTPRIPGHEFAGVVNAVGDGVTSVAVGDRVLSYFYLTCGECDRCRRGDTNQCTEFEGWFGVQRDGAYAESTVIPASNVLPLPDGASFADGAVAADGLATPLHVCERTGVRDDDTVLVVGAAGRIGVHLSKLAALRGARVLAADVTDDRLAHVDDVTPDAVTPVDARGDDFTERVMDATPYGDGPTVVVDTVGDVDTLRDAWDALAMGGDVVSLTTHHERSFAPLLKEFVMNEATLQGSRFATKDEVVRAARLLADDRIEVDVPRRVGLDDVPDVHEKLRTGETFGTTILQP
ncbi:MAG: alcohol dehydrogenase catalytic domain-containing protein [Halobacterium sp.]